MSRVPFSVRRSVSAVGGGGVADQGGVDELLEAHDQSATYGEVVGDTRVQVLAGGFVDRGVAGQDHDVLTVDDVGVVVRGPAVPVGAEPLHDVRGHAVRRAVGAGQRKAGHFGPFHVRGERGLQRVQVGGGGGQVLAAHHVGGSGAGGEIGTGL